MYELNWLLHTYLAFENEGSDILISSVALRIAHGGQ